MRHLVVLFIHLIAILTQLLQPGGVRSLVAESLLLKHQLLIVNRSRQRSPTLVLVGPHPCRFDGALGPPYSSSPFRNCTEALDTASPSQSHEQTKVPYAVLTESTSEARPERTQRRTHPFGRRDQAPNWGCPRIAQQIPLAFHLQIDKDVVRRILARHYRPSQDSGGPSWLTFLGHTKDSIWSIDLFRCESATLRTHWVLVVMDQYTRRIIGFGVHAGKIDGAALCRMFNRAIRGQRWMPNFLSSNNDPLYRFQQWQANLRILEVTEIKSVPYVPLSHPFVERLIGTVRREYLDHILFWTTADLENKLLDFRTYFNNHRTHDFLEGRTPDTSVSRPITNLRSIRWQPHCRALYQTPVAA
jgi:putative transposase